MIYGQYNNGEQSHRLAPPHALQIQFTRGSQQFLWTNRNVDHQQRRRARHQQVEAIETEDSIVGTKRKA